MVKNPVIILGAGATKACGGPLTDEILPAALNGEIADDLKVVKVDDREKLLYLTREFMTQCFHVPKTGHIEKEDCPNLPMVLSMLRRSIELDLPIGRWRGDSLVEAKRAIEYSIFAVIEAALKKIQKNNQLHTLLLEPLYQNNIQPTVISLNYDVIVDNAMFGLSERYVDLTTPDYGMDISTPQYRRVKAAGIYGSLFKIHGSLNFLYCETCKRLDLFVSEGLRGLHTYKALDELYHEASFENAYSCQGTHCRNHPNCDGFVSPILITPTFTKDYQNPHVSKIWKEAEAAMKNSDRAVIIGYSLPTDDVEIGMLFQRSLSHMDRKRITVVEYVEKDIKKAPKKRTPLEEHPTGQRFRSLLGRELDWHTTGFEKWLDEQGSGVFD